MKNTIVILITMLVANTVAYTQNINSEMKEIEGTIIRFAAAADNSDTKSLENLLDENFRIVMNQLFGSSEVGIVDKQGYLSKIGSKEWGGDPRDISINDIVVNGTAASAKVTFKGSKSSFVSLLTLIKNNSGKWKLVSDVPVFI